MSRKGYSSQLINEILLHIDQSLVQYHCDMIKRNIHFNCTLEDILKCVIYERLKNETNEKKLRLLLRNNNKARIQKKKRLYNSCKKMVDCNAWKNDDIERYCFKDIATNYIYLTESQWKKIYNKSFEDLQQDRLIEIKNWCLSNDSKLIDYPGLEKKTQKSVFNNFLLDLTINVLEILKDLYDFDLDKLTFSMVNDLSDKAVFGITKDKISYLPSEKNGSIVISTSEDGQNKTIITFDEEAFSEKGYLRGFDIKDQELLSYLINLTTTHDVSSYPIVESIRTIAKIINKIPSDLMGGQTYEDTILRLKKLAHATVDFYKDGHYNGSLHFFDLELIPDKPYVAIWPSDYLISQLEQNRITQMPAEQRNLLGRDSSKLLFITFMTQRVRAYKKMKHLNQDNNGCKIVYHYNHFLRFVNFGKMNKPEIINEIISALEEYKEKNIFIKDYKHILTTQTFEIIFTPLSPIEIQDIGYYFGEEFNNSIKTQEYTIQQLSLFDYIEE